MVGMAQAVFSLARQSYLTEAAPAPYRARALSTLGGVMRIGMLWGHSSGLRPSIVSGWLGPMALASPR